MEDFTDRMADAFRMLDSTSSGVIELSKFSMVMCDLGFVEMDVFAMLKSSGSCSVHLKEFFTSVVDPAAKGLVDDAGGSIRDGGLQESGELLLSATARARKEEAGMEAGIDTDGKDHATCFEDQTLGHPFRGVSVWHLSSVFLNLMRIAGFARTDSVYQVEPSIIRPKGEKVKCPRDQEMGAAYVDCIGGEDHAGMSQWMLSYAWGYKVGDIVDTLAAFCRSKELDMARTYIWMCCFCVNQWRVQAAKAKGEKVPFSNFQQTFGERVQGIGRIIAMMAPWREPGYIKRAWCVFEMFMAHKEGLAIEIAMPPAEREDLERSLRQGTVIQEMWPALNSIRVENSAASVSEDKEHILVLVRDTAGLHELNKAVSLLLKRWIQETCGTAVKDSTICNASLLLEIATMRYEEGQFKESEEAAQVGLDVMRATGMAETEQSARGHRLLGVLKAWRGDYDGAFEEYARARRIRELTRTLNTADGAQLLCVVGIHQSEVGKFDAALWHLERARQIYELNDMRETPDAATVCNMIGTVKRKLGDPDGAMQEYELCSRIRELTKTVETPDGAIVVMDLGIMKQDSGDLDGALRQYEHSKRIREMTDTLETPFGAMLFKNIGTVRWKLGDSDGALQEYERARQILELTNTLETATGAILFNSIGCVKRSLRDLDGAMQEFERSRQIRELTKTLESPDGATLCNNIGLVKRDREDLDGAMEEFERSWRIRELTRTLETSDGVDVITNLGDIKKRLGDLGGALREYKEAKRILDSKHMLNADRGQRLMRQLECTEAEVAAAGGEGM